jgi:hypothetical protein
MEKNFPSFGHDSQPVILMLLNASVVTNGMYREKLLGPLLLIVIFLLLFSKLYEMIIDVVTSVSLGKIPLLFSLLTICACLGSYKKK